MIGSITLFKFVGRTKARGEREWAGVSRRLFPKRGVVRGRKDLADANASCLILYQPYPYLGSAVAVETLFIPPAPPVSEEMFRLDHIILYPEKADR